MFEFKRLSILLVASALSANAMAADDWTGWYVGANAGYSHAHSEANVDLGGPWETFATPDQNRRASSGLSPELSPSGGQYGMQLGYDHAFGRFLLGGELSYDRMRMSDAHRTITTDLVPAQTTVPMGYSIDGEAEAEHELAARLKLGYANGRHAAYGIFGVARVDATFSAKIQSSVFYYYKTGRAAHQLSAMQLGAGYEYNFGNHWSLRTELLRTKTENASFKLGHTPGTGGWLMPFSEHLEQGLDYTTVRLGVNYRF